MLFKPGALSYFKPLKGFPAGFSLSKIRRDHTGHHRLSKTARPGNADVPDVSAASQLLPVFRCLLLFYRRDQLVKNRRLVYKVQGLRRPSEYRA